MNKKELKELLLELIKALDEDEGSPVLKHEESELSANVQEKIKRVADFIVKHKRELGF